MRIFNLYISFFALLLLASCSNSKYINTEKKLANHTLLPRHAQGFKINYFDYYKEVLVFSPWNEGEIMARYFLVYDYSISVPKNGTKIKIPLQSLGTASASHLEFLHLLGVESSISGISSPELIFNENIRRRFREGELINMGDAFNLNFEKVLFLSPDAVMVSGFNQANERINRIKQAGIPVIYNNEWTESSVLGRAEWIRFIAAFYSKENKADSIFQVIENNYNRKLELVQNITNRPAVLSGSNFRGTWYMPSINSHLGQLYRDAGAFFQPGSRARDISLPLSFEMVLREFRDADFWLGSHAGSIGELLASDSRYSLFRAVQSGQVYNNNRRVTATGGNDFWESAIARPDIILADLVRILHPELLPKHELFYMKRLVP